MTDTYQAVYDAVRSKIHGGDVGQAVQDAIGQQAQGLSFAIESIRNEYVQAAFAQQLPSVLYRPTLGVDGNKWFALYGPDLMEGVAGFGESPAAAMDDFNVQWHKQLAGAK